MLHGDASKVKQVRQALEDLAEEGLAQVFSRSSAAHWIVGVVGVLQLDVLKSRVAAEYGRRSSWSRPLPDGALGELRGEQAGARDLQGREPLEPRRGPRRSPGLPRPQRLGSRQHIKRYPKIAFRDTCELAS